MSTKEKRTYADRREYIIKNVTKRRKAMREKSVAYGGGKCRLCGYNKYIGALEFHHLDPTTKNAIVSRRGNTFSWEKTKAEIDKCVLLCANCHREVSAGIKTIAV